MAISINWATKVIFVPKADLTPVSATVYELDVNTFRLALKNIEDSEEGAVFPDTHDHATEATLSGVTYARRLQIINGYTVEFEDGQYTVNCVGANHNLADVKVQNQVSLIIGNSAGLVVTSGGAGEADWTATERQQIRHRLGIDGATSNPSATPSLATASSQNQILTDLLTANTTLNLAYQILLTLLKYQENRTKVDHTAKTLTVYDNDQVTPLKIFDLKDALGVASVSDVSERVPQ